MNIEGKGSKWNYIGPGLILAGAAIGVSHLVQATRAGADYGFSLLWLLLLACLTKYPFLQTGPRYAAATGKNLIEGYKSIGNWAYRLFLVLTAGTMFIILAAVTTVTAGIAEMLFNMGWSTYIWSSLTLLACIGLLLLGRYKALDTAMKIIVSLLAFLTLFAVAVALINFEYSGATLLNSNYWTFGGFAFIIAMMGWMPIPLDAAVWHSIWTTEKQRHNSSDITVKQALFDFNAGYLAATLIGVLFLALGALVMFGGSGFSMNSVQFASELIQMYQQTLGSWSVPLISTAALVTMFSTTLAITDAYPRVISKIVVMHLEEKNKPVLKQPSLAYNISLFAVPIISLITIGIMKGSFSIMVDFATSLSFLSAPFLAFLNIQLLKNKHFPAEHRPSNSFFILSYVSFVFLVLFCFGYLYVLMY
jgi:Mn2+/Fe2+ NRAMP family transporter